MVKNALVAAREAGTLGGLHGVLVLRNGDVLLEEYFPGPDENWGMPLGHVVHSAASLHDVRSVTKSIVGLLYGVALSEGLVPDLDAPLGEHYRDHADLFEDAERRKITVRHALSMKMGIQWSEDLPYSDPRNSEIAMEMAPDRVRYVLEQPMTSEPGQWWVYNGGATAIIADLITTGTGMALDAYARQTLFDPLAIENFGWARGRHGTPAAASGLRLAARDLAKIGQMVLADGQGGTGEEKKQIVPSDWLDQSFTPHAQLDDGIRYGLFWWLAPEGDPPHWAAGFGNGGQRLMVIPAKDLVIVIYAGNYNQTDAWRLAYRVVTELVLPLADRQ